MNLNKHEKLSLKNKIILNITSVVVLIAGASYFIIIPTIKAIKKMGSDIDTIRFDLEKKYIKGQSLNKLSNNLKKIESKLDSLDTIFINHNRALEFITTLEGTAADSNITQKINLMTDKALAENQYKKIPLQIMATGSYADILQYIINLETLSYYINITNIDINKTNGDEMHTGQVSVQITANTYWK